MQIFAPMQFTENHFENKFQYHAALTQIALFKR